LGKVCVSNSAGGRKDHKYLTADGTKLEKKG